MDYLKINKVYEYKIDLWPTGLKLGKGWKIRVEISSADFPQYSRNLNTGRNNETDSVYISATQKILHTGRFKSFILLPVM